MTEPKHQFINVADLIPTADNPRKVNVKSASFASLLASVKMNGVKIPVVVREHPRKKGKWDLRAGARRLAAAKQADLKAVPALVYADMDDEAAFDITFLENFAREDLTVLEEAEAVATLLEKSSGDVKAVAAKFDKSEKWIRMRANVHGGLSKEWLKAINKDEAIEHFGIGHLTLIARLGKAAQNQILEDTYMAGMSVDRLDKLCGEMLMDISKAPWDIQVLLVTQDNKKKNLPACSQCPKRTGHQPLLWADDPKKPAADRCMDPGCWKEHLQVALDIKLQGARRKYGDKVKVMSTENSYHANQAARERYGKLLGPDDMWQAKKTDKDSIPCFVVVGKQAGSVVWKKKIAGRSSSSGSGKGPKTMEQKRKILASKRWCLVLKAMRQEVADKNVEDIQHADKLLVVMGLIAHIGSNHYLDDEGWAEFKKAVKKGREDLTVRLWGLAVEHLKDSLGYNGGVTQLPDSYIDNAKAIIKLLGLEEDKYWADAVKAIPEPRAWSKSAVKKTVKKIKVKKKKVKKKAAKKKKA